MADVNVEAMLHHLIEHLTQRAEYYRQSATLSKFDEYSFLAAGMREAANIVEDHTQTKQIMEREKWETQD